jgi:hypothetical protein
VKLFAMEYVHTNREAVENERGVGWGGKIRGAKKGERWGFESLIMCALLWGKGWGSRFIAQGNECRTLVRQNRLLLSRLVHHRLLIMAQIVSIVSKMLAKKSTTHI